MSAMTRGAPNALRHYGMRLFKGIRAARVVSRHRSAGVDVMVSEELNERIRVRADFSVGGVTPRAFKRGERVFRIARVNASWEDRRGTFKRYHFSVEAEGNLYELHLDSRDMLWHLDRVCLEG